MATELNRTSMNVIIPPDWVPEDRATLVYVLRGPSVLLIKKLRGHGCGKVNAPGGKLEPGESVRACAVRELQEEVGIRARDVQYCATLKFLDEETGFSLEGIVFLVSQFEGTPQGTKEADPFWCLRNSLPYEQMWEDDRYWLPHVLEGRRVSGEFVFANDQLREWFVDISLTALPGSLPRRHAR